jgi:hypothetical protein
MNLRSLKNSDAKPGARLLLVGTSVSFFLLQQKCPRHGGFLWEAFNEGACCLQEIFISENERWLVILNETSIAT